MTDNKSNPLYESDDIFDDIFNSAGKEDFTDLVLLIDLNYDDIFNIKNVEAGDP